MTANDSAPDGVRGTPPPTSVGSLPPDASAAHAATLVGSASAPSGAGTIDSSAVGGSTPPTSHHGDLPAGTRVDGYTVLGVVGRGGMGVVYRAEQHQPRRLVALKLIRPGIASADLLGRFAYEVQILGRLQHPAIAQIYEAGTTDTGAGPQPYFAMELVQGRPLNALITDAQLGVRERLELFVRICEGVQHAHAKGVIHRDLKPANILVASSMLPKILDFGVARASDNDLAAQTLHTTVGQLIGTVPYMSPEQIGGDPRELDTRSDVYALGVILFELLAGRLPHDLAHKPLPEVARIIREDAPLALHAVNPALRGDLAVIAAHALEKDRVRRYQSASDLAADVQRYLSDEPIAARAPSAWYQLSKFARRNRALVAAAATLLLAIVGGLAVSLTLLARALQAEQLAADRATIATAAQHEADRQRKAAEEQSKLARGEAESSAAVNDFLNGMLASVNPAVGDREITVREVLDGAAKELPGPFATRPLAEAQLRATLARSYRALGLIEKASGHFERSLELRRRELGEAAPQTLDALNELAISRQDQGKLDEAETLFRRALPLFERTLGEQHGDTLSVVNNLGLLLVMRGRYDDAEPLLRRALAGQRALGRGEDVATLDAMTNLATLLQYMGKLDESEQLARESLATRRRVFGNRHPGTLIAVNNLGTVLALRGKNDEAEPLYRESLELSRAVLGDDHPDTLTSLANVAGLMRDMNRLDEAERLFREALAARRRVLGERHADTIDAARNLGMTLRWLKRASEAETLLRETLARAREALGDDSPDAFACMRELGMTLLDLERAAEAEPLLREAAERAEKVLGEKAWKAAQYRVTWVEALLARGNTTDAEKPLLAAHATLCETLGEAHQHTLHARTVLAQLYKRSGKADEARRWEAAP